jgi:glycosyltransferase involved in cell wall biosynthesis
VTTFFLQTGYRIIIVFDKLLSIEPTNQEIIATGVNQDLRTAFDQLIQDYGAIDSQSVIVLIPAYNEEGSVGEVIEQVPEVVLGLKTQIVVINDGSTDGTAAVARSKGALVLDMPTNSGQGAALKAGYLLALQNNVQYVAVVDGDGQWDPIDIEPLLAPLVKDEADFSQGSRKLGSTEVGDPVRDIGVSVFNRIISGLLGQEVGDTSSGIRCYKSEVLNKVRLEQRQYQSSEILISAILAGFKLYQHPVKMSKRTAGTSKKGPNWKYGLYYLKAVLQTTVRDKYICRIVKAAHT